MDSQSQREDIRARVAEMPIAAAWSLMMDLPGGVIEAQRLLAPSDQRYPITEAARDEQCRRYVFSELLEMQTPDALAFLAKAGAL